MHLGNYSFEEFIDIVKNFHGSPAPGILLGAVMLEEGKKLLPPDTIFDVICETPKCLPDAVQLLTLCTIGNGWLKIFNLGRYALSLYDKYSGQGVRVFVDSTKLDRAPALKNWFLKLTPKKEQSLEEILTEIKNKGTEVISSHPVTVNLSLVSKNKRSQIGICPLCKEAYPIKDGSICRACQGEAPYLAKPEDLSPNLKTIAAKDALGKPLVHDLTQIIPGKSKGAVFKKGQILTAGDLCRLQQMGREHLYEPLKDANFIHENEAAEKFAAKMAGDGVGYDLPPQEGKINFKATRSGLFLVDRERLISFNLVPEVMCSCRQNYSLVTKDSLLAGTRAIPLYLAKKYFLQALSFLDSPLFQVLPMPSKKVGLLITGNEVFYGHIEDKFEPIITNKVEQLGSQIIATLKSPDDTQKIKEAVLALIQKGAEIIITTAGLSVDPDDVTRKGLLEAGLANFVYGAPILPGAMTLIGEINKTQILGVPACALYFLRTSLDLILPRLIAGLKITRKDLAEMAEGGLCLNCKECTFPKCYFGK